MNKIWVIIIFWGLIFLSSCNKNKRPITPPQDFENLFISKDSFSVQNHVYDKYHLPLPIDLFNFLSKTKSCSTDILLDKSLAQKLISDKLKAIYLGFYNADLAYCTFLNNNQLSLEYFKVSKNLANELGIENGYSDQLYKRFKKNADNPDSLKKLANEAYNRSCNFLQENNKYNILPFIVVGGWFESLHIIIKSCNANDPQIRKIILNQEQNFKNLQKFLYDALLESSAYYYYDDLKKIIKFIQNIINLYNEYKIAVSAKKPIIYTKIINSITNYRNQLLNGKL